MTQVKKKDYKLNAEVKTISDYALILEHCNGYSKSVAQKGAAKSHGNDLFDKLLERNELLFQTGEILILD